MRLSEVKLGNERAREAELGSERDDGDGGRRIEEKRGVKRGIRSNGELRQVEVGGSR